MYRITLYFQERLNDLSENRIRRYEKEEAHTARSPYTFIYEHHGFSASSPGRRQNDERTSCNCDLIGMIMHSRCLPCTAVVSRPQPATCLRLNMFRNGSSETVARPRWGAFFTGRATSPTSKYAWQIFMPPPLPLRQPKQELQLNILITKSHQVLMNRKLWHTYTYMRLGIELRYTDS